MNEAEKQKQILDAIRRNVPVGYIPNHTYDALPELVMYYVNRSGTLAGLIDEAEEVLKAEADSCVVTSPAIRFVKKVANLGNF